ncbi:hypothetical protein [Deinococcus murrayi]|uniref:hypothetical protein n=1 Tax=Deinococcus murrayi TaxID=68910 RepID=UPI0012F80672|nr:hypothetical protein [Deinococcus murrayi]
MILSTATLYLIQFYVLDLGFNGAWVSASCALLAITIFTRSLRPDFTQSLTAKNLALGVFALKLFVAPLSISVYGFKYATLFYIPSSLAVNNAYNLVVISFFSFAVGWALIYKDRNSNVQRQHSLEDVRTPMRFGILLLVIGLLGMVLRYQTLGDYLNSVYVRYEASSPSILQFLGSLLKPLAVFGVAVIWENLIRRSKIDLYRIAITLVACLIIVALSLSSNRATIVYPLIAFLAMVSVKYRPLSLAPLVGIFVVSLPIISAFGDFRVGGRTDGGSIESGIEQLQVYFGAPQFIAPMLETELGSESATVKSSLLESLPIVGESYRYTSGSYVYNQVIYRNLISIVRDQVYPVAAEIFINFGLLGMIMTHIFIGMVYCRLDAIYLSLANKGIVPMAFFLLILYFNASIILSISVLSQFFIYNALAPLLVIWGFMLVNRSKTTREKR